MISYQIYKILHVVSIVMFFALYAAAAVKAQRGEKFKLETILTGVCLVIILIAGMGLVARIGIPHGESWPIWLKAKLGIWIVIGVSGHMILKRFSQFAMKYFWASSVLLVLASYLANYKP